MNVNENAETLGALNEIPTKTDPIFKKDQISKFIYLA